MEAEESNSNSEKPTWARIAQPLFSTTATTFFAILAIYALINAFPRRQIDPSTTVATTFSFNSNDTTAANLAAGESSAAETTASASASVKVYMYDLPLRFTYGVIAARYAAHGVPLPNNVTSLSYPGHQHMGEWFLFLDMNRPQSDRVGSPVTRVMDPEEADLFYVPFFSSLSQLASTRRPENGSDPVYNEKEEQEALMEWLEGQEYWRRNGGRDHVFSAADPKALLHVMDRVRNSVLLVVGFGRLRGEQGSLVKDVVVPYPHRLSAYEGDVGLESRPTLLFFMGARYRKEEGKIRDILFQVLENEEGVIIKQGVQSTQNRREASNGMHTSKFCLNPAGDTSTSCRLFDSIVSLCVPVVVSDTIELPFEDTIDYRKIGIFVKSSSAVKTGYLASMLRAITPERILEYQKEMKEVRRYFEYGVPSGAVDEIWRQVSKKLPLIKLMSNRDKRLVKDLGYSCICTNQTTNRTL